MSHIFILTIDPTNDIQLNALSYKHLKSYKNEPTKASKMGCCCQGSPLQYKNNLLVITVYEGLDYSKFATVHAKNIEKP